MNSKYAAPEVIEVGNADELILGSKAVGGVDEGLPVYPNNDLDD